MNRWAALLASLSPEWQRAIARHNRIRLPRHADAPTRAARLRAAICPAASVRAIYATLDAPTQAALQQLSAQRGGLPAATLLARCGAVRSLRAIAASPAPTSIAERLLLLGWLIPRQPTPTRPARYLLPPELRAALPRPLDLAAALASAVTAPSAAPPPLALGLATLLLLTSARAPLLRRVDGGLRAASRAQMPAPHLAAADHDAALTFVAALLADLGCLRATPEHYAIAPSAAAWLALPAAAQLARLRDAWYTSPAADSWLPGPPRAAHGIDWPTLRQRLVALTATLPADTPLRADALPDALTATGPLTDAATHGFRWGRAALGAAPPWRLARSRSVVRAALAGPLAWLDVVRWPDAATLLRPSAPATTDARWWSDDDGALLLPIAPQDAAPLMFAPLFAALSLTPQAIRASIDPAASARHPLLAARLAAYLAEQQLHPPATLLPDPRRTTLIATAGLVVSALPAALDAALATATFRSAVQTRLAPGVALLDPARAAAAVPALAAAGVTLTLPAAPLPAQLAPFERAVIDAALANYRAVDPDAAATIDALRSALHAPPSAPDAEPFGDATTSPPTRAAIRRAIRSRRPLALRYRDERGRVTQRVVQPLLLERAHDDVWYVRAYCHTRRAERSFRYDRIVALDALAPAASPADLET